MGNSFQLDSETSVGNHLCEIKVYLESLRRFGLLSQTYCTFCQNSVSWITTMEVQRQHDTYELRMDETMRIRPKLRKFFSCFTYFSLLHAHIVHTNK